MAAPPGARPSSPATARPPWPRPSPPPRAEPHTLTFWAAVPACDAWRAAQNEGVEQIGRPPLRDSAGGEVVDPALGDAVAGDHGSHRIAGGGAGRDLLLQRGEQLVVGDLGRWLGAAQDDDELALGLGGQ